MIIKRYVISLLILSSAIFGQLFPINRNIHVDKFDFEGLFKVLALSEQDSIPIFEIQLLLEGNLQQLYGGYNANLINNIKIFDNTNETEELDVTEFDVITSFVDSSATKGVDTIKINYSYIRPQKLLDTLSFKLKFYFLSRLKSFDFNIYLDDELKSIIYLNSNMIVVNRLLREKEYTKMLNYMERNNNAYMHEFFADVILSIIKDDLLKNIEFDSLDDINKFTERLWYFISDSELYKVNADYRDSSTTIFNASKAKVYDQYLSYNASNLSNKERYELSKLILDLCPECAAYQQQYYSSAAEYFYQSGNYATALKYYNQFSGKSTRIEERINKCVLTMVEQYFNSNQYSSVENLASEYPGIISADPEASYYLAESYFNLTNYSASLKKYLDLVKKWNPSNNLLSLSQARDKIQILYTYIGKFDEAIRFNVQAYNTTNDKKYISNVILNTRLKYLIPLLKFVSEINALRIQQVPNSIVPFYFEEMINCQTGENIKVTHSIPNELPIETIPNDIPFSLNSTNSFISSSNSIIDIDFTNEISFSSNVIVEEIQKNPNSIANWRELIIKEENQNRKMFLELLSYIIENSCTTDSFMNLLKNNSNAISRIEGFKYLVYVNKEKVIVFDKMFDNKLMQKNDEEWNKSFTTNAYYVQVLNYNQEVVEDLTIPIYMDQVFQGVLKIGLDKNGVL